MGNFWDFSSWGFFNLIAVLLASLLAANMLKRSIPVLQASLIPTSVLGGGILLLISAVYNGVTGQEMFDTAFFGGNGTAWLELLTYHMLALGYGQGTGQAMNYGSIYETDYGFVGGKSFGLTVAAMGFLSASFGGVIHLNYSKRKGRIHLDKGTGFSGETVEGANEIPMQDSIDKFTLQIAFIMLAYLLAYLLMYVLGNLVPGMRSTIYGFNFLLGVLAATVLKNVLKFLNKCNIIHRQYTNNFLLTRATNFFFDIMVTASIAAIRLGTIGKYWGVMIAMGLAGLVLTYAYVYFVCRRLFPNYQEQQFLAMYGMLTGTASTGIILLREIDGDFKTPVADNLVYQNFPAMVFGFPILLLATMAPTQPGMTLIIVAAFLVVINILLFRSCIFKKKK